MLFNVQKANNTKYVECDPTAFVIQNEGDILDLIAACGEHETNKVMIYEDNFSADFFDLKTQVVSIRRHSG